MINKSDSSSGLPAGPERARAVSAGLLTKNEVANLLGCSARHVDRLKEAGRMPKPVRLGALVRWSPQAIADWIAAGCPAVRTMTR